MRIAICGFPRSGKTTMALLKQKEMQEASGKPCTVLHTDVLLTATGDWSDLSTGVANWFDAHPEEYLIVEGMTVARALRKWKTWNPELRLPFDKVIFLSEKSYRQLTPRQLSMGKGARTIFEEVVGSDLHSDIEVETL